MKWHDKRIRQRDIFELLVGLARQVIDDCRGSAGVVHPDGFMLWVGVLAVERCLPVSQCFQELFDMCLAEFEKRDVPRQSGDCSCRLQENMRKLRTFPEKFRKMETFKEHAGGSKNEQKVGIVRARSARWSLRSASLSALKIQARDVLGGLALNARTILHPAIHHHCHIRVS